MPFDFAAVRSPFRMQPGLRALAPGSMQLTPNAPGDRALAEKLEVLSRHADEALVAAPGFDAAAAIDALSRHAAAEAPDAWLRQDDASVSAPRLGWRVEHGAPIGKGDPALGRCLAALPERWRVPALLCLAFAEDFAVIDGASARIPWLAVCLPSHWAPRAKVGRHFAEVHAPVADNRLLLAASDHLARLVTGEQRWERFVWTVTPEPRLDMHPARVGQPRWNLDAGAEQLVGEAFFRTERQTFIPLADRAQAVFTIHVESRPLAEAITAPAEAAALHDAIASMSEAVLAYRGLAPARDRLLAWLAARAA